MRDKIIAVTPAAKIEMLKRPDKSGIIVASDVESFTIGLEKGEIVATIGRGKPEKTEEVRQMFLEMVKASEIAKINPYYQVYASSGAQEITKRNSPIRAKDHTCYIELNPDKLRYFGTEQGFKEYVNEFLNFFSSPDYCHNGKNRPIGLTDVAGGIDLAVLARLNAVIRVDEFYREHPEFAQSLRYSISHSAVGIHATVLRPFNPTIDEKVKNWPWLEKVTDYAMGTD